MSRLLANILVRLAFIRWAFEGCDHPIDEARLHRAASEVERGGYDGATSRPCSRLELVNEIYGARLPPTSSEARDEVCLLVINDRPPPTPDTKEESDAKCKKSADPACHPSSDRSGIARRVRLARGAARILR